jgi:hypothetical protein
LIRHLDPEIDIARCRSRHTDDASANPLDPHLRGFRRKFVGPHQLTCLRIHSAKDEMGLSGLLWPGSNPGDRSSRVDVRHETVCPDLRMFAGGEVQTTFPEKTSIRCIVDPKGKFRKTAGPGSDTSGEDPRAGMVGRRAIVLDVEFVGFRGKYFPGLRIVRLDGDKRDFFVLKSESRCDDLHVRSWSG